MIYLMAVTSLFEDKNIKGCIGVRYVVNRGGGGCCHNLRANVAIVVIRRILSLDTICPNDFEVNQMV